jgi:hypothetical protein
VCHPGMAERPVMMLVTSRSHCPPRKNVPTRADELALDTTSRTVSLNPPDAATPHPQYVFPPTYSLALGENHARSTGVVGEARWPATGRATWSCSRRRRTA